MTQVAGNAFIKINDKATQKATAIDANQSHDAAKGFTEKVEFSNGLGGTQSLYVTATAKAHLDQHSKNPNVELSGGTDLNGLESAILTSLGMTSFSQQSSQAKL